MKLNKEQLAILDHVVNRAAGDVYCGDSPDMQVLVKQGMMKSAGMKSFVPDEYFRITDKGREARRMSHREALEARYATP
jgi:hypothetical protein